MRFNRRWIIVLAVAALAVTVLLVPRITASDPAQGSPKLEGAWIARVTSIDGVAPGTPLPFQWSYVLAPSASGRVASLHGSVNVPFPPIIPYDAITPIIGELIQTGPDTMAFTTIWYGVRKGSPVDEIVLIGTARGEARFIAPGKLEARHHFAIFLPSADSDGDGLPEGEPLATFDATTTDTRVRFGI
jgi:hypothetical protein